MRATWTIARRELKALFDSPTAYILLVVFVAANDFLFFREVTMFGVATLRPMLDLLPWVFLFLVPAVTMRAVAEDMRSGVIEVVLAQPITESEFLAGKYLGQLLFLWIALALTVAVPIGLALGARLQWGVVVAQYVGSALLLGGLTGVGIWASSVTRNQITAFIMAVAVMFVLILVGLDPLLVGLPPRLGAIAGSLGVLSHFTGIARGVIDLRDAVYFVSLAAAFLVLAYFGLMRRRLTARGPALQRLRLGTILLVAGVVIVNLFGRHIGGRLDLTPGRAYTLSPATRKIVGSLPDLVTLKLFASAALPPQVVLVKRDIDDMLADYRSAGKGKLRVIVRDPTADSAAARDARTLGIPPVQFNVVGRSELEVKEGYLGIAIQYAEGVKTIPFVRQANDLEYRLTSDIRALTNPGKPTVGLISAPDRSATASGRAFSTVQEQLEQQYTVQSLALQDSTPLTGKKALVIVGSPDSIPAGATARLKAFLDSGGGILLLANGMGLSAQAPLAMSHPIPWNDLLRPYGIAINPDMVYDLASNEQVAMPTQFGQVLMPYPLWLRALSTRASPINAELDAMFLPWASTLDTSKAPKGTVTPLFTSSPAAGVRQNEMFLNPTQTWSRDSLARRLLAVQVNPRASGSNGALRGRLVVVGSADFVADRYARNDPGGAVFVQNAVDWLAQDEVLIAIRSKDRSPSPLVFASAVTRDAVKYGNMIGVPLLVMLLGALRLLRRQRRTRQQYHTIEQPQRAA